MLPLLFVGLIGKSIGWSVDSLFCEHIQMAPRFSPFIEWFLSTSFQYEGIRIKGSNDEAYPSPIIRLSRYLHSKTISCLGNEALVNPHPTILQRLTE